MDVSQEGGRRKWRSAACYGAKQESCLRGSGTGARDAGRRQRHAAADEKNEAGAACRAAARDLPSSVNGVLSRQRRDIQPRRPLGEAVSGAWLG